MHVAHNLKGTRKHTVKSQPHSHLCLFYLLSWHAPAMSSPLPLLLPGSPLSVPPKLRMKKWKENKILNVLYFTLLASFQLPCLSEKFLHLFPMQ